MNLLENRVAIVTGGNSGIGQTTALRFAREGASVVIGARRADRCAEVVEKIRRLGARAEFVQSDISSEAGVSALVERALEAFGRLDVAFNNAGIVVPSPVETTAEPDFDNVIATNLKGTWLSMKYEIAAMRQTGRGVIVNNASIAGLVGIAGAAAYCASKHGIVGLTKAAALECAAQAIRVNAVCPALVLTPLTERMLSDPVASQEVLTLQPLGRAGTEEEIADAVLWLCSDLASFVTGHALAIDGGYTCR